MTDSALCPELAEMLIIFFVTGKAILRCSLQARQIMRADVTLRAQCQSVNTNQFERNLVVVEV